MEVNIKKLNTERLILIYVLVFGLVYSVLYMLNIIKVFPSSESLLRWDANWYKSIVNDGYNYIPNQQCNVAFFPLFPYVWHFLGGNAIVVSIFNTLLYLSSIYVLIKKYELDIKKTLFFLSIPPVIFNYIPYAEALFFVFSVILLIGLDKDRLWMILLGILGAGLSRSALVIFIPSFLFLAVMTWRTNTISSFIKYGLILVTLGITFGIVVYIQWKETGILFAFQKVQVHWNHVIQFPKYPLSSWKGIVMSTDLPALIIGAFSGIEIIILFLNRLNVLNNRELEKIKPTEYFSLGYCLSISLFVFLFQGGDLHSLNRYIFATSYFWFFMLYFWKNINSTKNILLVVIIVLFSYSGVFSMSGEFKNLISYVKIIIFSSALFVPMFFLKKETPKYKVINVVLIILLFILQIHYLHIFLDNKWVG